MKPCFGTNAMTSNTQALRDELKQLIESVTDDQLLAEACVPLRGEEDTISRAAGLIRIAWRELPHGVFWNLRANLQILWLFERHPPVGHPARHVITTFDADTAKH